jgi:hypothetical protein
VLESILVLVIRDLLVARLVVGDAIGKLMMVLQEQDILCLALRVIKEGPMERLDTMGSYSKTNLPRISFC